MNSLSLLGGYNSDPDNGGDLISDEDDIEYDDTHRLGYSAPPQPEVVTDSDSDSNDEDVFAQSPNGLVCVDASLPSASTMFSKNLKDTVYTTTFDNEQATANAALEVHVKMTETLDDDSHATNKKRGICRMYKKGQCNKGRKCFFSHILPGGRLANLVNSRPRPPTPPENELHSEPINYDHEFGEGNVNKRKRVGVTNTLLPPKKSMKNFDKQYSKK